MTEANRLAVWFDHGLGDCSQMAQLLQLYIRRGFDVRVHYEDNKAEVWKIAGTPFCELPDASYHQWGYHKDFNHPRNERDGVGNKAFHNLNSLPLPTIGSPDQLWEELSNSKLSGEILRDPQIELEAEQFLADLPRPIILIHTTGTNIQHSKNIPSNTVEDLYRRLLDETHGSLVLLDWDNRVPLLASARVRHLKTDWGHINLTRLWHLMTQSDLLIGVDSGPLHFAAFTDLPCLGVFHGFYPTSVTLPRNRSALMTRGSYRDHNVMKRKRWNIIEYGGDMPTAEEIARHAVRMLWTSRVGCRYFRDRDLIGRDLVMQQMIRDWSRSSLTLSPYADRHNTMDWLFQQIKRRYQAPQIVETGCIRSYEDWSAGYSTYLFSMLTDSMPGSEFTTIDNSREHLAVSKELTLPFAARTQHHLMDSVRWLRDNSNPVDILYLDSLDAESSGHAEHGLAEIQAAEHSLGASSLVVYDDTVFSNGWKGKGALGVPYLLSRGWRIAAAGYQVILEKPK